MGASMGHEVTVLGAGIVGICTALSLAERGHRVRVIDRGAPGQETSFGNAGVISPWSVVPQAMPGVWRSLPHLMFGDHKALSIRAAVWPKMLGWGRRFFASATPERVQSVSAAMSYLCAPSIDLFRRHLDGTGHEGLVVDSWYVHAFRGDGPADLTGLGYALRREKGADVEMIGRDELRALEPALSDEFKAAVLIKGQARAKDPGRIGQVLAQKAETLGVVFVRAEVRGLTRQGDLWRVECDDGQVFDSAKVVIAMGAWSMQVLKGLGLKMPLLAERGYHLEFGDPGVVLNNSVMDVDAHVVLSSMNGGVRIAGQAEFAPVDAPIDPRKRTLLQRIATAAVPDLNTDATSFWMGRRPSFPDSLPALGALPSHPGLYCNFGHSHYGLMMAPKSGEHLAELITGHKPNVDASGFAPYRF